MTISTHNQEDEFDHVPPAADALLESFRGLGYSPGAAIADLIDNSIAADATQVRIEFLWRSRDSVLRITDNGRGMTESELIEAMRPGGRHPLLPRAPKDLGRFGLGLKTAALSQGRVLCVISRCTDGCTVVRCWDLDYVAKVREWRLLRSIPTDMLADAVLPDDFRTGTTVIVGRLDRLVSDGTDEDDTARARFLMAVASVERHLAMTFHRFLEGPKPRLQLQIGGDGAIHRIEPWDPFLQWHPATTASPSERLPSSGGVEVQGFVLPHKDRITANEFEAAAGPDGWLAHQGFFVYRNQRLLVSGGWLGLGSGRRWTRDDVHRLARLRLDLPNNVDQEWKVDIRKSAATPPPAVRYRLQALAERVRQDAREVFAWRGGRGSKRSAPIPVLRAWTAMEARGGTTYRVDRSHPAVQRVLDLAGSSRGVVEEMLTVLEATLPVQRIWLDVAETGDLPSTTSDMPSDQREALRSLYSHLRIVLALTADEARSRLLMVEPFSTYPSEIAGLPDHLA